MSPLDSPTRCCPNVVSPHPAPLPRGEGTATARRVFSVHWLGKLRGLYGRGRADDSPSPRGEGRGGQDVAYPTVLCVSQARRPRNQMASRFRIGTLGAWTANKK